MILLDTHVLILLANEPVKLSPRAIETIHSGRENDGLAISAITLWELAWLATHGRITFTGTIDAFVDELNRINKLTTERFLAAVGRQPWDIVTYRIAAEREKPLPSFLRSGDVSRVDLFTKSFRLIARKRFSVVDDEAIDAPPAVG